MEYCLVNLFIGCAVAMVWSVCFYNPVAGWADASQAEAAQAQTAVGGEAQAVDFHGSSGSRLAEAYRRVLTGIAMPFP